MKLGIVYDGLQNFLEELREDWRAHFETSVYAFQPVKLPIASGRINPMLYRRSLGQFLNRNDVVFFEWAGENLVAASRMPHRAAIIARLHSGELFNQARLVDWNRVDWIVLISNAMQRKFNEMYPGHEAKTVVLPAGKSLTRFAPVLHPFGGKIAMLGHIIPVKRVYDMVLTMAELRDRGYDFTLYVGGQPKDDYINQRYYASVLGAVKKLGLSERVFFDGWVDPSAWLPDKDIFISHSSWEGQQNALIEAMACGCYCLSHFWDGAEEILPEEYLYTTTSRLVDKIIAYAKMPEADRRQHQTCQREIAVERFNGKDMITNYRALIEAVGKQAGKQ